MVTEAVKAVVQLIGNANPNIAHLRHDKVIAQVNLAIKPIVQDEANFKKAAPLLFRPEVCQKSIRSQGPDSCTAMRSGATLPMQKGSSRSGPI